MVNLKFPILMRKVRLCLDRVRSSFLQLHDRLFTLLFLPFFDRLLDWNAQHVGKEGKGYIWDDVAHALEDSEEPPESQKMWAMGMNSHLFFEQAFFFFFPPVERGLTLRWCFSFDPMFLAARDEAEHPADDEDESSDEDEDEAEEEDPIQGEEAKLLGRKACALAVIC
jgi:hypothetical protein